jgi:hypothetical protein
MYEDEIDDLFDDHKPQSQTARATAYAVVPQGPVEVEIVAASIGDVVWMTSEANPTGTCLKLRLSAGRGMAFVFSDLPKDKKPAFRALAAALGLELGPDGKVSIGPPEGLVGRRVRIEVGHYQTRAGETKACVRRWIPADAVSPEAAKPKKPASTGGQLSRNAVPQFVEGDEIPF